MIKREEGVMFMKNIEFNLPTIIRAGNGEFKRTGIHLKNVLEERRIFIVTPSHTSLNTMQ